MSTPAAETSAPTTHVNMRDFTSNQLLEFNGMAGKPIYVAVCDHVFDVSTAPEFAIGNPEFFCCAGRNASRALALNNFTPDFDNTSVTDLGEAEQANLTKKFLEFKGKYVCVGRLSTPPCDLILNTTELAAFTGAQEVPPGRVVPPVYIGINGKIIDVSYGGYDMYRPGSSYAIFAGIDASRALGKMSFEPADLQSRDVSDLTEAQKSALQNWESKFVDVRRYPIVGRLSAV